MELITESLYHKTLNGTELTRQREARGLSQFQFAIECGWSQQYQSRIEAPSLHEIPVEHAKKIQEVLKNFSAGQF